VEVILDSVGEASLVEEEASPEVDDASLEVVVDLLSLTEEDTELLAGGHTDCTVS
jgi:hypothetical protein